MKSWKYFSEIIGTPTEVFKEQYEVSRMKRKYVLNFSMKFWEPRVVFCSERNIETPIRNKSKEIILRQTYLGPTLSIH